MKIDRAEVENLLSVASDPLFRSAIKVPATMAEALCRLALEVMDAPEVLLTDGDDPETNEPCSEILGTFPSEWAGRRVRLVRVGEE